MPQITPGTSFLVSVDPSIGDPAGPQESITMNPCPPVEYGRNYTKPDADAAAGSEIPSGGLINIGTVTMTGAASVEESTATQYTVANPDGSAEDETYQWSSTDASATFSAATAATTNVTFSTDGTFDLTCTVSSATATDSPVAVTRSITVTEAATPLSVTLSSTDFTTGNALPVDVGINATGQPTNPALTWVLAGDNQNTVSSYRLRVLDSDANGYIHWSVDGIATTTLSIAATTNPGVSNWTGNPTINQTGGGQGAAFANGWEGCSPPLGDTHNYTFVVLAMDASNNILATSNTLIGTYTG
jgi:phosphatidylethanolamine-binding protein (PEBP) family uncharacterized protein